MNPKILIDSIIEHLKNSRDCDTGKNMIASFNFSSGYANAKKDTEYFKLLNEQGGVVVSYISGKIGKEGKYRRIEFTIDIMTRSSRMQTGNMLQAPLDPMLFSGYVIKNVSGQTFGEGRIILSVESETPWNNMKSHVWGATLKCSALDTMVKDQ